MHFSCFEALLNSFVKYTTSFIHTCLILLIENTFHSKHFIPPDYQALSTTKQHACLLFAYQNDFVCIPFADCNYCIKLKAHYMFAENN